MMKTFIPGIRLFARNLFRPRMISIRIPVERWETVLDALEVYENTIDDCYAQAQSIEELNALIERASSAGTARVTIRRRLTEMSSRE